MPAGTVVSSGSLVSPGGQQGIPGPNAVSTDAGNQATFGSDSRIYVPDPTPVITSVRLRSFNSISNPNFEIDARTVGSGPATATSFAQDRWYYNKVGTMTFSVAAQQDASASPILVPGTSFAISQNFFRFTLGTVEASLAATDRATLAQYVEGPSLRELISDVYSISVLVRTSVAGLKFGIALQDSAASRSLVLLATVPNANTWTLLPFPNNAVFASGGSWNVKAGNNGYVLLITLAAGSTFTASANGSWLNANVFGALGQDNFASKTTGSTFDIAFVQHEPGALCTTLIDKPFTQNLDESMRYFQKSYSYPTAIGSNVGGYALFNSIVTFSAAAFALYGSVRFPKVMAKSPGVTMYHPNTGIANQCLLYYAASGTIPNATVAQAISSVSGSDSGLSALTCTAGTSTAPASGLAHWVVDTGW